MMTQSMTQISESMMTPISMNMMIAKVLMTMMAANVKSATKMTMMKTKISMTALSGNMMTAKALMTSQHQKCNKMAMTNKKTMIKINLTMTKPVMIKPKKTISCNDECQKDDNHRINDH